MKNEDNQAIIIVVLIGAILIGYLLTLGKGCNKVASDRKKAIATECLKAGHSVLECKELMD